MSNKIKSLFIILAVFSLISLGATYDSVDINKVDKSFVDNPLLPPNDDGMGPILPPDDQFVDNPLLPPNDDGMGPILPPDDQFVDNPLLPPNDDGIIFPNPVPPTTNVVVNSVA